MKNLIGKEEKVAGASSRGSGRWQRSDRLDWQLCIHY